MRILKIGFIYLLVSISIPVFFSACTGTYSAAKKYSPQQLQQDFNTMRGVLERDHPSLYWYTSKDSMDHWFDFYCGMLTDSMTELQFGWRVLAPMIQKIHCGHTSVALSKGFSKASKNLTLPGFPYYLRVWKDTMVVSGSQIKNDHTFKRGTLITAINGVPNAEIIARSFNYLPVDGYSYTTNFTRLSSNFPYYHRNIFGLSREYKVNYITEEGEPAEKTVKMFAPVQDSTRKEVVKKDSSITEPPKVKSPRVPVSEQLKKYRSLEYDSLGRYAIMNVNSFTKGRMYRFYRSSFRQLNEKKTPNLILDLRNNGGGEIRQATKFLKYLSRDPFRFADTVKALSRSLGPFKARRNGFVFNNIWMWLISSRQADGYYHLRSMERKVHKPSRRNHYDGNVYIITGGPTFSAASVVANVLKGQEGITLVGEPTGGGWYGNNGVVIPWVTLHNTKVRFRLPYFRLIQYRHRPQTKGLGVAPDVYIGPDYESVVKRIDNKMAWIKAKITAIK